MSFVASCAWAAQITPQEIVRLTNQSRMEKELAPLTENEKLKEAAQKKAYDMISNNYFSHTSPAGKTPWYWFRSSEYEYRYAGENLAINYKDPLSQHTAWMNSPTHRENILDPNYQETGVAVLEGEIKNKQVIISVQLFAQPKNQTLSQKYSSIASSSSAVGGSTLMALKNTTPDSKISSSDLKLEPSAYSKKEQKNSFVLSAKINKQSDVLRNIIVILTLISLAIVVHINIISSINPNRLHHISTTNIIILMIIFSMLGM